MQLPTDTAHNPSWLDRPVTQALPRISWHTFLTSLILLLALASRFYIVELRVMSHDEVNHVVPSFDLYQGRGYTHSPVTHGPFQFHVVALSYFMLGDNDFSARVPSVLFSIATVAAVMLLFPRYLGKTGALLAGLFFLISPYMLFYGRYVRNESFVGLWGVLLLYGVLRYLDRGDRFSLFLVAAVTSLHFATKETAFIYTAQLLLFLAFLFADGLIRLPWPKSGSRNAFLLLIVGAILLLMLALGIAVYQSINKPAGEPVPGVLTPFQIAEIGLVAASLIAGIVGIVVMIRSIGLQAVRSLRSFDLLVVVGTTILPMLAAFPVRILGTALHTGWNPTNYSDPQSLMATWVSILILTAISVGVGLWWKPRLWVAIFAVFYAIFTILYTTVFTNGLGFLTGLVGSLGYWLEQQGVQRGTQPLYYYALVQVPIYEFLAALGSLLALYFGLRYRRFATIPGYAPAAQPVLPEDAAPQTAAEREATDEYPVQPGELRSAPRSVPTLALLLFWSLTALVAYSIAGEKMPWLTVHIALPMLLAAAWGVGFLPPGGESPTGAPPWPSCWYPSCYLRFRVLAVRCSAPPRPFRATPSTSCAPPVTSSFRSWPACCHLPASSPCCAIGRPRT
jgi:predicted membrane-bound mannosyltransferase